MKTLIAFLFILGPVSVFTQSPHAGMAMPPTAMLDPGVGRVHHAVSTKNARAQLFFEQGLAYMYAFNHDEAARAVPEIASRLADMGVSVPVIGDFHYNGHLLLARYPATARILHVGDFNTGDASELMYGILTAAGTNQLIDPLNPARSLTTNFDGSTTPGNLTEASDFLEFRDDYEMMTTNIYFGTPGGLALVPGTYHPFGNNGTTAYLGSANSGANTNGTAADAATAFASG